MCYIASVSVFGGRILCGHREYRTSDTPNTKYQTLNNRKIRPLGIIIFDTLILPVANTFERTRL